MKNHVVRIGCLSALLGACTGETQGTLEESLLNECDIVVGDLSGTPDNPVYRSPDGDVWLDATAGLQYLGVTRDHLEEAEEGNIATVKLYGLWEDRDIPDYSRDEQWIVLPCAYLNGASASILNDYTTNQEERYSDTDSFNDLRCIYAHTAAKCGYQEISNLDGWCNPGELEYCTGE